MKKVRPFILLFCLVILGFVSALLFFNIVAPTVVRSSDVSVGRAVEAIYATAYVEPVTWAAISPIKTGRIIAVSANEGESVRSGDVLARIDDADLRAQMMEIEALSDFYVAELRRAEELLKKGHISQERFDESVTNLAQTEARVHTIREQIRQLSLTAPMDGTVLWRDVELGEVKPAGEPLFWIGQPKPLHLVAEVDEEDIPFIRVGQQALVTADAFPERVMKGHVHRITPKGDPVTKSYRVYMALPDDTPLMIGMTVETNVIVQEKDAALLVPAEALVDGPAVWKVVEKKGQYAAYKVIVTVGIHGKEQIEILDGLKESDRILLPPFNGLKDGKIIRIRD